MKTHSLVLTLSLLTFFVFFTQSTSLQQKPTSNSTSIHEFLNKWTYTEQPRFELSVPMVIAGVLSFLAASISSAGGIGGGGLFIPIMNTVAGLDLKTASSFSAFMVTGGSVANVVCNLFAKSPKYGNKILIDFDLALVLEPCMLLGVSVGVICNVVFPEWLITVLFAVFLAWSTLMTCNNGVFYWKLESDIANRFGSEELENGSVRLDGNEGMKIDQEPLLGFREEKKPKFPWMKLGVLVIVWLSFFAVNLLRGNKYGEGIISIEPCGSAYWILSSMQLPLAIIFTVWILCKTQSVQDQLPSRQGQNMDVQDTDVSRSAKSNKLMFPLMSLLAGLLGGLFGIGGGMLISPLLLQASIAPEVTAATCSFMVFFSSTMSAIQYVLLGMENTEAASIFAVICFVASLLGLVVVQRAINLYGRASLIVFSVGIVMALSAVLTTSFGALNVWKDYSAGNYMGFKLPC